MEMSIHTDIKTLQYKKNTMFCGIYKIGLQPIHTSNKRNTNNAIFEKKQYVKRK